MTHHVEHPLQQIYRDHGHAVHEVARHICGPSLAADVTQDVFSQLWRNPHMFDPRRGSMRAFLVTVARRRAIDVMRAEGARRAREGREEPVLGSSADVDQRLLAEERSGAVAKALRALPAVERDAIVAAYFGGCTYREAARILGAPEGTIKSRIRSGLRRLQAPLREVAACAPG